MDVSGTLAHVVAQRRALPVLPVREAARRLGARPDADGMVAMLGAVVAVGVAVAAPSPIRIAGAVAVVAMTLAVLLESDGPGGKGRVVAVAGLTALTVADAGIIASGDPGSYWQPMAALIAYPMLGRALMRMMGQYRIVRPADVIAESVLIGATAAVLFDLVVGWWTSDLVAGWDTTGAALPSVLVGLDVALLVVVARSGTITPANRGPVLVVAAAIASLLAGHMLSAAQLARAEPVGAAISVAVVVAFLMIGVGTLEGALVGRPTVVAVESPLFSSWHAAVVVCAILGAPAVLLTQLIWDVSVSGAAVMGASLIGTVLASHVVSLLRERAHSEHQATHDLLTNLPNRLLFVDRLDRAIAHASRNGFPVGVLYIDLDRFKDVNDTLGHEGGDLLLVEIAARLTRCAREEDTVARLAGDEFAVLLPHLAEAEEIVTVAERVLEALREPVLIGEHPIRNGGSVGVAVYPDDGALPVDIVNAADAAMYRAKEQGGARIELFSAELHQRAVKRLEIETALHDAVENDQLSLHYQPIIDTDTGRIAGAEALIRWYHPEHGLLYPGSFIPIAEQSELIVRLGNWVIRSACEELARWNQSGLGERFISVNVSSAHFRADLVSSVTAALRDTGVDPGRLVIEITESAAVEDLETVSDRLRELREIGVRSMIDDFGTGYCGLQYLGDLPVAGLKIDRSFVQAMTPRSDAIVAATIAMARSLGLTLVAEGVETTDQRRFLERHGCERMQGYLFGRPVPADEFVSKVRQNRRGGVMLTAVPDTERSEGGAVDDDDPAPAPAPALRGSAAMSAAEVAQR